MSRPSLQYNGNRPPVSEAWSSSKQEHLVSCRNGRGCSCHFRLWQVILFLVIEAVIIIAIAIPLAVNTPWNKNLRNSADARTTETTVAPGEIPTTVPQGPGNKQVLKCGVAIVGGGTAGLLLAYTLLESKNETNVCVFEKEDRLGGKIFDHRFPEAPNVTVGLGEWHINGKNSDEWGLKNHLSVLSESWTTNVHRVEARGVHADSFDALKSKAFPSLLDRSPLNNYTVKETAQFLLRRNTGDFSTARAFLSSYLTPEGAKLMEEAYGFNGGYEQVINPESFKTYLGEMIQLEQLRKYDSRPTRGMSEIIEKLSLKVRHFNGTIKLQEAVTSISKEGGKFVLETTNFTVQANKTVLTAGPAALKKMTGDVTTSITNHEIFKSIVSVPAFRGAAVYPSAWWTDSVAAQMNNSLEPLQKFVSRSYCLGITMPYKGTGPNGTAVLHTVANNGGCSDMWGNILKISKDAVDREMKRALEYKFQRNIPEEPLNTVYKYWEEGFWYFQKPGAKFSLSDIRQWAKRPLAGNDVFLVGKAFCNFGGWLQDTIYSANEALKDGWDNKISWLAS